MKLSLASGLCLSLALVAGCNDRFDEGYAAGYNDGRVAGEKAALEKAERKGAAQRRSAETYRSTGYVTTEVCGCSGVTVNGKHYAGGKTGCVKVFSDGTAHRY